MANREIELDEMDQEIIEMVFDEDFIESLCNEFESEAVKALCDKLGVDFPEDIFPSEEDS